MKNKYSITSYRTTHFQYQTLDKIHGEPSLDTLLHIFKQLKINAQSVPTTLGSGQLGYLALTLTEDEYNEIPHATPFIRPTDPGVFRYTPSVLTTVTPQEPNSPIRTRRTTRSTTSEPGTPTAQRRRQDSTNSSTNPVLAVDMAQQKAVHNEQVRQYQECQAVEQALR